MPISDNRSPEIVTVPFAAASNIGDYVFNFDLPTPPLNSGASQCQILWAQINYTADATVGVRVPVFDLLDDTLTSRYSAASINTQTAGQTISHSFLQGVLMFPLNIFGIIRTFPVNGLFAFDNWRMRFQDLNTVSAGDAFSGFVQVRLY